ncbi:10558_t:CDS:2 [Entrophospora sp. SA101]|nr:10558_t:CDS:2 [Entrophospora sp. SA101]
MERNSSKSSTQGQNNVMFDDNNNTKSSPTPSSTPILSSATTAKEFKVEEDDEEIKEDAYNEETGEINWDCPCLGGMANGPCGEQFKAAFSCFVYSKEEPKGVDCLDAFKEMNNCFKQHPDVYHDGQVNQLGSVILPPRIIGIDSNIIKFRHIALVSKWIEHKENYVGVTKQSINFNLLLRGSKDGFSATTFHNLCDNQGPTLVVLKVKETGEILGGYNPLSWLGYNSSERENSWMVASSAWPVPNRPRHSSTFGSFGRLSSYDSSPYQSTIDSFIFSLGNGQNMANAKLSRVLQDNIQFAVCSSQRLGPCFGQTDLRMNDSFNLPAKCTCQCYDYDKEICESQSFSVEEFEVFQVVNKDDPALNAPSPVQVPREVPNYPTAW